jgi:AcrR family transcriptional regulator
VAVRLTRAERREQIRADLIASARAVFLRRGFHAAALEEIATEAGWSKGAVFSNFAGKDDLFLAVLDDHNRRLYVEQATRMRTDGSLAGGLRAAGDTMIETLMRAPRWNELLIEFWSHAARDPVLRARASTAHEEVLTGYAALIAEMAAHDGLEFVMPARDVARSAASLARGLAIERMLDPASVPDDRFAELFTAHVLSFTRPRTAAD